MSELPGLTLSVPLFFSGDSAVDYSSLEKYLYGLEGKTCISAVYSMAYNTRYRMLDFEELLEVNEFILARADEIGIPCYVGQPYIFNETSLSKYLERIARSRPAGISLLYPERYFGIDEPIIRFIEFPKQFGLKSVIHEMKLVSGFDGELINWPAGLIRDSISLDNVVAIKEDSKDDEITGLVLEESLKHNIACILAGGGKRRALQFVDKGMDTWLNGTTMFFPGAIDKIYPAVMNKDEKLVEYYCDNIEKPFFDGIVSRYGWHLAHKAALQYYGFGDRWERFPHAVMPESDYRNITPVFEELGRNMEKFRSL